MEDKLVPAPFNWKKFLQTEVKRVLPTEVKKAVEMCQSSSTDLASGYSRLLRDKNGNVSDTELKRRLSDFKECLDNYYHYLGFHQAGPLYGMAENERLKLLVIYKEVTTKCSKYS